MREEKANAVAAAKLQMDNVLQCSRVPGTTLLSRRGIIFMPEYAALRPGEFQKSVN